MVVGDSIGTGDSSWGAGGDSGGDSGSLRFRRLGGGGEGGVSGEGTRLRPVERADFRTGCDSLDEGLGMVSLSAMIDGSLV